MALSNRLRDVRAHMLLPDLDEKREIGPDSGAETARPRATPARVIPHLSVVRQEGALSNLDHSVQSPDGAFGLEMRASAAAAVAAAEDSEVLGTTLITPLAAARRVFPALGTAGGKARWVVLVVTGLLSLLGVTAGYVLACAFGTRIRAGVASALLVSAYAVAKLLPLAG